MECRSQHIETFVGYRGMFGEDITTGRRGHHCTSYSPDNHNMFCPPTEPSIENIRMSSAVTLKYFRTSQQVWRAHCIGISWD